MWRFMLLAVCGCSLEVTEMPQFVHVDFAGEGKGRVHVDGEHYCEDDCDVAIPVFLSAESLNADKTGGIWMGECGWRDPLREGNICRVLDERTELVTVYF